MANSLTEFDAEEAYRDIRNDGYEEGLAEGREAGRAEGLTAGFAQGTRQKAVEAARNLYANGVSIDLISNSLKMSEEEIRELTRDIVSEVMIHN